MKIFLSAKYESRDQMKVYADFLRENGYEVNDTWIKKDQMDFTGMDDIPSDPGENYAYDDFFDVKACDVFIAFTEKQDAEVKGRGGRHVEFGFAWIMQKPIIIVGPSETVFHSVPALDTWKIDEWDDIFILEILKEVEYFLDSLYPRNRGEEETI